MLNHQTIQKPERKCYDKYNYIGLQSKRLDLYPDLNTYNGSLDHFKHLRWGRMTKIGTKQASKWNISHSEKHLAMWFSKEKQWTWVLTLPFWREAAFHPWTEYPQGIWSRTSYFSQLLGLPKYIKKQILSLTKRRKRWSTEKEKKWKTNCRRMCAPVSWTQLLQLDLNDRCEDG